MSDNRAQYTYQGHAYVRPVNRGVVLTDAEGAPQVDDMVEILCKKLRGWHGSGDILINLTVEVRLPERGAGL